MSSNFFLFCKELRLAAEGTVDELQCQLRECQSKVNKSFASLHKEIFYDENAALKSNEALHEKLEEHCQKLSDENALLRDEVQLLKKQGEEWMEKAEISKKASEKSEKAKHDAEVALEIAKKVVNQTNTLIGSPQQIQSPAEIMHDKIKDLNRSVIEEREEYKELYDEHETLLAVLAQQDLERATLCSALLRFAGDEALKQAISDAQQSAIQKFGEYIEISSVG